MLHVRVSIRVGIEFFLIKKNTVYTLSRSSFDTVTFHPLHAADKRYRKSKNRNSCVFLDFEIDTRSFETFIIIFIIETPSLAREKLQ